jgi:hypothetical protein
LKLHRTITEGNRYLGVAHRVVDAREVRVLNWSCAIRRDHPRVF